MSIFFPVALFYAALLALALWGAWLGWTRSKSPTARYFVVAMALVWAGFTVADAWQSYQIFGKTGVAEIISGNFAAPITGSFDSCSLCYEGPAGKVYVVAASRISDGHYVFATETNYSLHFDSGQVEFNHEPLEPGCHTGKAKTGDVVDIVEARKFRLEVGESADCD